MNCKTPTISTQLVLDRRRLSFQQCQADIPHCLELMSALFVGESTVFRQQGGRLYYRSWQDYDSEQTNYFYFWEFKDGNGNVVTIQSDYGRTEPITTKPLWQNVPSPAMWGMQFGYKKEDGEWWVWQEDYRMVAAYDEKNTYGRILMDATPQYPSGTVKKIDAQDFFARTI